MKVLSSKVAALFLLLWGFVNAVPFFGDFRHHVTLPQLIPPMLPIEPQSQASTQRFSQIWQPFGNNPFPVYSNFDGETEFLPLEHQQQQQQRGRGPQVREKPFNIDVVTSDVGGDSGVSPPNIFFQQSFPFFGNDFFNSFGGFGFGAGPHQEPWWKGPNVCTDKEEDEKVTDPKEPTQETGEIVPGASETVEVHPQLFDSFHFSVNSCIEKPNKHVCTRIINQNGKKKTLTITRQCCHGYGRPRNADVATPCDKIEIKDIEETAVDMGAKEFIASAKSNGLNDIIGNRKNITIFMPIDSAFSSFSEQMLNENNLVESKSDGIMRNLFLRHIVLGEVNLDDVSNDQLLETQMAGQKVRINSYQLPPSLGTEPLRYTANCVPVEKHDKLTEQGLVHTLGGVMKPVTANVMDIIRQRNDLSVMRTVLEKTKLNELLEGEKPVTIFVPTDEAFEKLEPHLRRALKEGKGCATNILKNHILDLTFCSVASIAGTKTTAYNILGEAMRFNRSKTGVDTTSEASEIDDLTAQEKQQQKQQEQPVLINGNAKIIVADLMGTNGVVHIIDTVIPTTSALPLSTLMKEKNVTLFKGLVEAAGLDDKFDDMDNATIFAPTDKALEGTKWAQILAESPEKLKNNPELLEFINYHVVNPMTKTCDLTEKLLPTAAGGNVRINLYSTHALFSNVMNRATVNCARLVHFDDESCGSVLHQVDKVLTAPKANLLELLESNPSYSKFLELVRAANLSSVLTNMDQSFTLLVPKDEVFEEVEDWEKTLKKDQHELENLVKTHIVNDVVCCAGIIPTNWPFVRTIESINGAHLHITRERRPKIENAGVTKCDTIAQNGIVHEINDIIVPKRRQLRPPQQQQPQSQHSIDQFGDLFF